MTVKAYDRQQTKLLAVGTLLALDNQVDPTTGMVKMRAQFDNKNSALFPNQFVNVQLLVKTLNNATVIPTAAIQHGPGNNSNFVYLLNKDNTVSVKPVVPGVVSGNDTTITSGIVPGQVVVTQGVDKLTEGALVSLPDKKQSTLAQKENNFNRRNVV
jgi:multidrug efflux system membrane fusion protein